MASISMPATNSMTLINSNRTVGLEERESRPAEALSITPRVEPVQEKRPAASSPCSEIFLRIAGNRFISFPRLLYLFFSQMESSNPFC